MKQFNDNDAPGVMDKLRSALLLLGFGLGALAFLVAIDRPEWFVLRPASGTATALSVAGDTAPNADPAKN